MSLPEIMVMAVVLLVALAIGFAYLKKAVTRETAVSQVANLRQFHLAMMNMEIDNTALGLSNQTWPGDTGHSFSAWAANLVDKNVFSRKALAKMLSAPGRVVPPDQLPTTNTSAALVYAVREDSPSDTIFMTSANFTNTPTGGVAPDAKSKPYGNRGFVVVWRGGSAMSFPAKDAGRPERIGSYAPLCP